MSVSENTGHQMTFQITIFEEKKWAMNCCQKALTSKKIIHNNNYGACLRHQLHSAWGYTNWPTTRSNAIVVTKGQHRKRSYTLHNKYIWSMSANWPTTQLSSKRSYVENPQMIHIYQVYEACCRCRPSAGLHVHDVWPNTCYVAIHHHR